MNARMVAAALLAVAVAPPGASAKTRDLKLRYPAAGQASLAEAFFKSEPPKARTKGKLPKDVGLVAGSRKRKRGWVQDVIVFRRKASSRAHAADITLVYDGEAVTVAIGRPPVSTDLRRSFLPGGTPLPASACSNKAFFPGVYRGLLGRNLSGDTPGDAMVALVGAGCGHASDVTTQTFLCDNGLNGCIDNGGGGSGPTGRRAFLRP